MTWGIVAVLEFIIVVQFVFFEWLSKMFFLLVVYPGTHNHNNHGHKWKKATKHYKTNWTLLQRLLWIPLFKEKYEEKYVIIGYWSYLCFALSVVTGVSLIIFALKFPDLLEQWTRFLFAPCFLANVFKYVYEALLIKMRDKKRNKTRRR